MFSRMGAQDVASSEKLERYQTHKGKATNATFSLYKEEPTMVHPASKTFTGPYFLSNLDQIVQVPIEMMMSFKGDGNKERDYEVELLKEALQKVLVEFYPLGGRLIIGNDGKMVVVCTDEGVPFVKATSEDNMEVLGDLSMIDTTKMRQLVHHIDNAHSVLDIPMITLQVTKFKCGGIILGVVMNHVLMDGEALSDFLICWSELARGSQLSIQPFLDRAILSARQTPEIKFPHLEYSKKIRIGDLIPINSEKQLAHKSFCFTPSMISHLKKSLLEDGFIGTTPTTFQVISALVWTLRAKACEIKPNETTKCLIAVDSRHRLEPRMPEGFFGNGIVFSCAECLARDLLQKPFSFAVQLIYDAIKKVTESYIRSAIDYLEVAKAGFVEVENACYITKWSRLRYYDVNFGWGTPMQVTPTSTVENLVVFLSQCKDSENIVISLGLPCAFMEAFNELFCSQFNHSH